MLLSTLRCAERRCQRFFTQATSMWYILADAQREGWTTVDEEVWFCPDHSPSPTDPTLKWVVGCYTCGFEEDYDSEEAAKDEYTLHECEADTWIWDPEKVANVEARRAAKRSVETARVNAVLSEAAAMQDRIESYANKWLRIRNFFLFWRKEHIHERDEHHG